MQKRPYNRDAAVSYARKWAYSRNPTYSVEPTILVAAHTYDALDRPLDSYEYEMVRFLHIDGVRVW